MHVYFNSLASQWRSYAQNEVIVPIAIFCHNLSVIATPGYGFCAIPAPYGHKVARKNEIPKPLKKTLAQTIARLAVNRGWGMIHPQFPAVRSTPYLRARTQVCVIGRVEMTGVLRGNPWGRCKCRGNPLGRCRCRLCE